MFSFAIRAFRLGQRQTITLQSALWSQTVIRGCRSVRRDRTGEREQLSASAG